MSDASNGKANGQASGPSRPSLRRRLALVGVWSALTTALLLTGLAVFSNTAQQQLRQTTMGVIEEQRIGDAVIRGVMQQISIAGDALPSRRAEQVARFDSVGAAVYAHLRGYLSRPLTAAERQQIERIKEEHQQLEVAARRVMSAPSSLSAYSADASADMQRHAFTVLDVLRDFVSMRERALESLADTQADTMRRVTVSLVLLVALFALAQVLMVARFVRRRVTLPLEQCADAVSRVGAGDRDVRLPSASDQEFAELAEAFNAMSSRLTEARADLETRNSSLSEALSQVRTTQDELVRSETLSAIGRMTAGLAHELNNPLATVLASSELLASRLRESAASDSELSKTELESLYVSPILHEARRARLLVRSLLQFARRGDSEVRPVPFRESLEVVCELRQFAFAAAGVRLDIPPFADACIMAERQHLQGVLLNVLNNALDALSGHERQDGAAHVVRVEARPDREHFVVTISDNGPGLREPARVFEAFYTTKDVGEGTGLGLALVDRFMTTFGGSVHADNVPGGGARFTLVFRLADPGLVPVTGCVPELADSLPTPASSADLAGHAVGDTVFPVAEMHETSARPCVLVVDDEAPLLRAQDLLLRRLGVDVVLCGSVVDAQRVLEQRPVQVVLCDVKMPAASGVVLLEWVERHRPHLIPHFAFVTGDVEAPEIGRFAREHPDALIAKPFDVREYLDQVRRLLDQPAASAR